MASKWGLALAVLVCVSCGDDAKPPTGPSGGVSPRLTLVAPQRTLAVGESEQLAVVVTGADGVGRPPAGPVEFRSSNEAICVVWAGGVAVAVAPGQAMITASADGLTATVALSAESRGGAIRHVQGRVLDFASQAGLPGVTVGFGPSFPTPAFQTTTDASGAFAIDLPAGDLVAYLEGVFAGTVAVHVGGPAYRADLYGNVGTCVSRYGTVTDVETFQPVAGATVTLGGRTVVTGPDGWYRIDLGCSGPLGFGTTFIYVTHPGHREFSRVVGRGVAGVSRIDAELQRP
jgi:hypothetical protein